MKKSLSCQGHNGCKSEIKKSHPAKYLVLTIFSIMFLEYQIVAQNIFALFESTSQKVLLQLQNHVERNHVTFRQVTICCTTLKIVQLLFM